MDAALQYTLSPQELSARMFQVEAGQELKIEELLAALVRCGYVREDQIEGPRPVQPPGRHRGLLLPPGARAPVRVEFWGDEVDSVSCFDLDSQRRTDPVDAVTLAPCVEVIPEDVEKLAQKIEKLAASLRGKRAPKAKEVLLAEAEKLRTICASAPWISSSPWPTRRWPPCSTISTPRTAWWCSPRATA